MRLFQCDEVSFPLPEGHRFPIEKYARVRAELLRRGAFRDEDVAPAPLVEVEDLRAVHDSDYVEAFLAGRLDRRAITRIGFPWSPDYARRCRASVGGTVAASEAALEDGLSGNLAGGTHHAHRDFGSGYCSFNDIAVAAVRLLRAGRVARVLVVDLDVHQGDGTASLFAGDERVFTCSVHGARNFPRLKPPSDLDVPLPDGTGDEAYLEAVERAVAVSFERSRPDVVFYQAGVDPLAEDRLGRLSLTLEGLRRRDRLVFETLRARGTPGVITLGGGYAEPVALTVEAHANTFEEGRASRSSRASS